VWGLCKASNRRKSAAGIALPFRLHGVIPVACLNVQRWTVFESQLYVETMILPVMLGIGGVISQNVLVSQADGYFTAGTEEIWTVIGSKRLAANGADEGFGAVTAIECTVNIDFDKRDSINLDIELTR